MVSTMLLPSTVMWKGCPLRPATLMTPLSVVMPPVVSARIYFPCSSELSLVVVFTLKVSCPLMVNVPLTTMRSALPLLSVVSTYTTLSIVTGVPKVNAPSGMSLHPLLCREPSNVTPPLMVAFPPNVPLARSDRGPFTVPLTMSVPLLTMVVPVVVILVFRVTVPLSLFHTLPLPAIEPLPLIV